MQIPLVDLPRGGGGALVLQPASHLAPETECNVAALPPPMEVVIHRRIYSACAACMCSMHVWRACRAYAACTRSAHAAACGCSGRMCRAHAVRMQLTRLRVQVGVTTGTAIVYDARLCHYGRHRACTAYVVSVLTYPIL